jgi:hypothetical protein
VPQQRPCPNSRDFLSDGKDMVERQLRIESGQESGGLKSIGTYISWAWYLMGGDENEMKGEWR